jgi:hypothetical protein
MGVIGFIIFMNSRAPREKFEHRFFGMGTLENRVEGIIPDAN